METGDCFQAFLEKAGAYGRVNGGDLDDEQLVELFCGDCEFYKPGGEQLECGAFKILRALVRKESISIAAIADTLR